MYRSASMSSGRSIVGNKVQRTLKLTPAQYQPKRVRIVEAGAGDDNVNHVHFIGIGGSGMLPLAALAAQQHMKVTGWDDTQSDDHASLKLAGFDTRLSLAGSVMPDAVVVSSAIDHHHDELKLAR